MTTADARTGEGRSGFVGVLGWTNVGKSTLLNRILEQKLAITSRRTQTTRYATSLVFTDERGQIVFTDTPGYHAPRHLLNELMLRESRAVAANSDLLLHLVSPDVREEGPSLHEVVALFRGPRLLVVNKMDLTGRERLAEILSSHGQAGLYREILPVSAVTGENVDLLVSLIFDNLPKGVAFFPEDHLSDRNERFFMAEIIREKVIRLTRQEIPHAVAVVLEASSLDRTRGLWKIQATIYVEKESQKGIVIGGSGRMLKEIGTAARMELQRFLDGRVHLELWVKVRRNWTRDPQFLREIGYREER